MSYVVKCQPEASSGMCTDIKYMEESTKTHKITQKYDGECTKQITQCSVFNSQGKSLETFFG